MGMKKDGSGATSGSGCVAGGCGFLFIRSTVTANRSDPSLPSMARQPEAMLRET
jgi:hypothetical protein